MRMRAAIVGLTPGQFGDAQPILSAAPRVPDDRRAACHVDASPISTPRPARRRRAPAFDACQSGRGRCAPCCSSRARLRGRPRRRSRRRATGCCWPRSSAALPARCLAAALLRRLKTLAALQLRPVGVRRYAARRAGRPVGCAWLRLTVGLDWRGAAAAAAAAGRRAGRRGAGGLAAAWLAARRAARRRRDPGAAGGAAVAHPPALSLQHPEQRDRAGAGGPGRPRRMLEDLSELFRAALADARRVGHAGRRDRAGRALPGDRAGALRRAAARATGTRPAAEARACRRCAAAAGGERRQARRRAERGRRRLRSARRPPRQAWC